MVTSKKSDVATVLDLESAIVWLGNVRGSVLSVYVDTSPSRIDGKTYLLSFRDGIRSIRSHVAAGDADEFEAQARRAERYLTDEFTPHAPGLALFAGASLQALLVVQLPESPPADDVAWVDGAEIGPLLTMLDENERFAVALFDAKRARVFTFFLGAIETAETLEAYVPAKQATGGWFGLQQTSFARHREDHLRRHAQRTAQMLMSMLRKRSFDHLLMGGPDEPLAVLRHQLPRPLRARLSGTLDVDLFASDAQVLAAALQAAEAIERQDDARLVDELMESATTPHVVLGLAGTLTALAEGRVYVLLLADDFAAEGGRCATCGRLVVDAQRCPDCAGNEQLEAVTNLREAVVHQARAQGARLEILGSDAAARLSQHAGIAAWTRF